MDIKTLESFRLSDAISFHDELNPKLWAGMKLRPEVKKQLKIIADDFMDELGISGLDIVDVTVSGSNAAYSYTPHSDLDLHLLVDMSDMPNDEVYKELFNAKKNLYNDSHDIKIHGVPIEVYVQDASEPVVSLGEYSIKNDDWIKLPTKRRANLDQTATKQKYEKLLDVINSALKSKNLGKVNKILKKIRQYRQAGLDKGGEFGPENLAYKALRSQGYITKLYALRDKLHSEMLTIENMYQDPEKMQEAVHPDVTSKTYFIEPTENVRMGDFEFNARTFTGGLGDPNARGLQIRAYDPKRPKGKNLIGSADFIVKSNKKGNQWLESDDTEVNDEYRGRGVAAMMYAFAKSLGNDVKASPYQSQKGREMWNKWGKDAEHLVGEDLTQQYASEKTPAINPYGGLEDRQYRGGISEASGTQFVYHVTPTKNLKSIAKQGLVPGIGDRSAKISGEKSGVYVFPDQDSAENAVMNWLGDEFDEDEPLTMLKIDVSGLQDHISKGADYELIVGTTIEPSRIKKVNIQLEEASGYIPSEKEKNDPRFKTALTVDVKPDSIKKNAKAFYWKTSRAGIPPTANPSGKF